MMRHHEIKMVFKEIWTPVFSFLKKKYDFNEKKKQRKKQDLSPRSSSLKSSALPTELPSLITDHCNILLYILIHHQTKLMKSNTHTIYHEICIYAKSPHPNSVFCISQIYLVIFTIRNTHLLLILNTIFFNKKLFIHTSWINFFLFFFKLNISS